MTGTSGRMVDGEHILPVRIYYEDTDTGGIVYYANYLRFAERARTEILRLAGVEQRSVARERGVAFAVRNVSADYRRPAYLDDLLEVRSRLTRLGAASMDAVQTIARAGTPLVEMKVGIACVRQDGRPVRIPADLRDALSAFVPSEERRRDAGRNGNGP